MPAQPNALYVLPDPTAMPTPDLEEMLQRRNLSTINGSCVECGAPAENPDGVGGPINTMAHEDDCPLSTPAIMEAVQRSGRMDEIDKDRYMAYVTDESGAIRESRPIDWSAGC